MAVSPRIITIIIATSLVAAALLLSIICVSTDSWVTAKGGADGFTVRSNTGLWRVCFTFDGESKACSRYSADDVRKSKSI